jgi:hypothetical protein
VISKFRRIAIHLATGLVGVTLSSCGDWHLELPAIDVTALPHGDGANAILIEVQQSRLEIDPTVRDPITAVAACAEMLTLCYVPGSRSLDACVSAAPTCSTDRPWLETVPCCPSRCRDQYERARRDGATPRDAYDRVYLTDPICFPGVTEALAGGP